MVVTKDDKQIKSLEHVFNDLIRRDKAMPEELLTSLKIVENDVVIIIASLLQDKGKILNKKT